MAALKEAVKQRTVGQSSGKGKWFYGRRVRSSGAPPTKHRRKRFMERPKDRCEKHHAYRANCGCGKKAA